MSDKFEKRRISLIVDKINTQITHYQVSLGWFIFRVDVLSLEGVVKEWGKPIGKGGFGEVMTGYTYGRKVYVVKRFMVEELN